MDVFNQIPKYLKSYYVLGGFCFFMWLLIFDSNDILTQLSLRKKETDLQETKAYYQLEIEKVKAEREALFNNKELLERIAREKFYMKEEGEDIYIIVEQ